MPKWVLNIFDLASFPLMPKQVLIKAQNPDWVWEYRCQADEVQGTWEVCGGAASSRGILFMFTLLFRVDLTDRFSPVYASHQYCKLSSARLHSKLSSEWNSILPWFRCTSVFLQDVWALSSYKALEHKKSMYSSPIRQPLTPEPFLLLPIFKAHRDMARSKGTYTA